MTITVSSSADADPKTAASAIASDFKGLDPVLVVFFASSEYNPEAVSKAMKNAFPQATVLGCSTAGEIISGKMQKGSLVAMALEKDVVRRVRADFIDIKDRKSPAKVLIGLAETFGSKPLDLAPDRYLGMVLVDGLSCAEEQLMEKFGDLLDITVIGGSAGDDLAFSRTWVYLDGKAATASAVIALIETACPFDVIKTQSFCGTKKELVPTAVDEVSRKVLEFNGKPAVTAYSEATGTSPDDIASQFMKHPVGLMSGGEPFVRSPQRVEGSSICFYCQIRKDIGLELLTSTDIVEDTKKALLEMERKRGPLRGIINFNCILRTLELEQGKKTEAYGKLFTDIPTVGFSTYGEEYIGHINQTATMLVFL